MIKCDSNKISFDRENRLYIRNSYLLKVEKNKIKSEIEKNRKYIFQMFNETDPYKLHLLILSSDLLNKFSEVRVFPYTSFKYHLLLTCSLYWNLKNNNSWKQLYLTENQEVDSQF